MRWLRTSTVARILGVSRWTVWRLATQGTLEARRIGGIVQVSSDSLEAYQREASLSPLAPEDDRSAREID